MKQKRTTKEWKTLILRQWNGKNLRLLLWYFLWALAVNLIVEFCNRRTIGKLFQYLADKPVQFLYGTLIIYLTLLVCLLFRKRNYLIFLFSSVWIGLSVASFIMLSGFRSTPLTAPDIAILRSVRDIIQVYMSNFTVVLILIAIAVGLGLLIYVGFLFKSHKVPYAFALTHLAISAVVVISLSVTLRSSGYLDSQFPNIPDAYQDNGFVYCFTCSALYQGIEQPEDYQYEKISAIVEQANTVAKPAPQNRPNIVYVQLESFFDVKYMAQLQYSEDPVPNFTRLKESCSSGLFSVPSIGAGTVNTEFEVLSQMNLQHFGMGEYPYKTVVRYRVCDSIAYALKELGYTNHAIHNNNATFYSRDRVYRNFGFDSFTSVEYMNDVQTNPLGWAKDSCLTFEILDAMAATEGQDFVFTVSVQPHGQYPSEVIDENQTIYLTAGMEEEESRKIGFEYYINQLHETDQFVGELTDALSRFDEDTVVVFYGDHLPSFQITNEELSHGNVQTTEYLIWANFDLPVVKKDIYAFQLSSTVMDKIGITSGLLTRFHLAHAGEKVEEGGYMSDLMALDYDILYGEQYSYGGQLPFAATDLHMGTREVRVTHYAYAEEESTLYLVGENFTPYSVCLLNGAQFETQFISPTLLKVTDIEPISGDQLAIGQTSKPDPLRVLSTNNPLIYQQ